MKDAVNADFVQSLRDLPLNWDSYGSPKIGEGALKVLQGLQVVPTSPGGIQVEWHCNGYDLEIEFNAAGGLETVLWGKA